MDAFKIGKNEEYVKTAEYLDRSAFDEKFEIDLKKDYIRNIYHIKNKYQVPVLSGGYREMYRYCSEHLIFPEDQGYDVLMDPDRLEENFRTSETPGMVKEMFREKLVDSSYRWVQYIGITGKEHGVPEGLIWFYVFDIQNQKDRLEGKNYSEYFTGERDPLTGLRSREDFVPAATRLSEQDKGPWCCIAIDIQHFKIFNSWFGYEKGNYLICRIGALLLSIEQNEPAAAAYFGRDNFALMMHHDHQRIQEIYTEIRNIVYSYSNMMGFLPALGICLLQEGEKPGLDLYDKARLAVTEAKKSYTERVRYFELSEYIKTKRNYEFLTEFQKALADDDITIVLQPQCSITSGRIMGAEALARWKRKDGTIAAPGEFIPFLESSGFITELDKCVWEKVCRWLRSLLEKNIDPIPVSVNVSRTDIFAMNVSSFFYGLTERYRIPPRLITIEITESAYAENYDVISETVKELKSKGFSVFLDDFGAGYSSLNMLDKINTDLIKLDMAFLRKETSISRKGISIVESILGMTKSLSMPVIVEGVENKEQAAFLKNLGCSYAQGYYYYRPISTDELEALLSEEGKLERNPFKATGTALFKAREFLNENLFTDSVLNRILGAVAFYSLSGRDLTITRYNDRFRMAIGDPKMDDRTIAIQNYVVYADRPRLYEALKHAESGPTQGGSCEVRFYKSDGGAFWFHMQFFFLKEENGNKIFYGQVEDVTEQREQSVNFFEVLRKQSEVTMCMNLDRNTIQYVTGSNTLFQVDLPSMSLAESVSRTAKSRIENEDDRKAFVHFFDLERLRETYRKGIYHEVLNTNFRLDTKTEPVEFSTYYIRYSKNQDLLVYAFTKRRDKELLRIDPLTGFKNRFAYNETMDLLKADGKNRKALTVFSIDINGLKSVNDTYGHAAGDELIRASAHSIGKVLSPHGSCYRIGGDEFVAFIYGDPGLAEELSGEIDRDLSTWSGEMVKSASVATGFASSVDHPDASPEELVKFADMKMYRAKSRYYQTLGIDRRIQQAAYNSLCNSYAKILKADLIQDRYEIIKADDSELIEERGYEERLSAWIRGFAEKGQVHPADRGYYLERLKLSSLREHFRNGGGAFNMFYRRKIGDVFSEVMLEMIPAEEHSETEQNVFIYVKNIGK